MKNLKKEWLSNIKGDVLAGIVVGIALVPEAIGFALVLGVEPMVGLYGAFCVSIVTAIFGGRIGMISGATGAMALVLASLVRSYGIEYMFAATILSGVLQIILGIAGIGNLLKFIPRPVMIGFVNALGILIFVAQIPNFKGKGIEVYLLILLGIAIIYFFPRINKSVPAPLVAIVILTIFSIVLKLNVLQIGDMGEIKSRLPHLHFPKIPLNIETFRIIFPYSVSLSIVGLVESMLTARLLDDLNNDTSNKKQECIGQGLGNIVSGFFGGMAGCAMIGQSVINQNSGGRTRLSSLVSGSFLMFLVIVLNKWVVQIPIAVLTAVMIVVSISTIEWKSIPRIKKVPKSDTIVMLATVIIVVLTDNLAYGVSVGIIICALFFVNKISDIEVDRKEEGENLYFKCRGQLFFASTTHFLEKLIISKGCTQIYLDVTDMRFWDETAVDTFDSLVDRIKSQNIKLEVIGLSPNCKNLLEKVSIHYPHL